MHEKTRPAPVTVGRGRAWKCGRAASVRDCFWRAVTPGVQSL